MEKIYLIEIFPSSGLFVSNVLRGIGVVNTVVGALRFDTLASAKQFIRNYLEDYTSAVVRSVVLSYSIEDIDVK